MALKPVFLLSVSCTSQADSQDTHKEHLIHGTTFNERVHKSVSIGGILTAFVLAVLQIEFYRFHTLFNKIVRYLRFSIKRILIHFITYQLRQTEAAFAHINTSV